MQNFLLLTQIILSVLITITILLQAQSGGLGAGFGGSSASTQSYHTRRGLEKVVFYATIILAGLIAINSIAILTLR